MANNISCPVDHIKINENRVRITAFQILLLCIVFPITRHWIIPAFLVADFFLRGFGFSKYSPLNSISGWLVDKLSIKNKPIDQAPKIFAAQVGFVFSVILFFVSVFGLTLTAITTDCILIVFSFLESVLGICAGCYVYSFLKKIKPESSAR
jgi:uncharacterized protein with PQ loop repeat